MRSPERLAALHATGLLDMPPEAALDRLTTLASTLLHAPIALITLLDHDRQVFSSLVGLPEPWASRRGTPLTHSFCQYAVASRQMLLVENALDHPVLSSNLAIPDLGVVSYVGIPLITATGEAIGTFCVIDSVPRCWTQEEISILQELARSTMMEIELRTLIRDMEADEAHRLTAERRRAFDELGRGLRHEINNSLATLLLMIDLLNGEGDDAERARLLAVLQHQALRIRDVVGRLEDVDSLRTRVFSGTTLIDLSEVEIPPNE